jgi:hypothetical protein
VCAKPLVRLPVEPPEGNGEVVFGHPSPLVDGPRVEISQSTLQSASVSMVHADFENFHRQLDPLLVRKNPPRQKPVVVPRGDDIQFHGDPEVIPSGYSGDER